MQSGLSAMPSHLLICYLQEDVVLPARRISKSRDATPVVSDNEDAPEADTDGAAAAVEADPAAKKGKLRKAGPDQQDAGSAKKRRKHSMSKTPEPSGGTQASLDAFGEVRAVASSWMCMHLSCKTDEHVNAAMICQAG